MWHFELHGTGNGPGELGLKLCLVLSFQDEGDANTAS